MKSLLIVSVARKATALERSRTGSPIHRIGWFGRYVSPLRAILEVKRFNKLPKLTTKPGVATRIIELQTLKDAGCV